MASKLTRQRTLGVKQVVKTAAWITPLPPGHIRVNITQKQPPKHAYLNTIQYRALAPSCSQIHTPPADFQRNFLTRLATLDPEFVYHNLLHLAAPRIPVLCCWETPQQIQSGECGCHRHLIAQWLEKSLDVQCMEVAHPSLNRFKFWKENPVSGTTPTDRPRTAPTPSEKRLQRLSFAIRQLKFDF